MLSNTEKTREPQLASGHSPAIFIVISKPIINILKGANPLGIEPFLLSIREQSREHI
jgi:hypothetical protein